MSLGYENKTLSQIEFHPSECTSHKAWILTLYDLVAWAGGIYQDPEIDDYADSIPETFPLTAVYHLSRKIGHGFGAKSLSATIYFFTQLYCMVKLSHFFHFTSDGRQDCCAKGVKKRAASKKCIFPCFV